MMLIATATGGGLLIMVSLRRKIPGLRGHEPAAAEPAAPSTTPAEEAQVPRWLRPSVRAARVETLQSPAPRERRAPLLFVGPVLGGMERLVVRYDLVQLLDRPDEALGMPVGELDTGDEIEVLERDSIWARVRTPAHRDGWVPAMTLAPADVLPPEPAAEPAAEEIPSATGEAGLPPLEELLAIAAERRALQEAPPPPAPEEPPKPAAQAPQKRPNQANKAKKTNRRTSTRKKRH